MAYGIVGVNGSNFNTISELVWLNEGIIRVQYMQNIPYRTRMCRLQQPMIYDFDDNFKMQKFSVFNLAGPQPSSQNIRRNIGEGKRD